MKRLLFLIMLFPMLAFAQTKDTTLSLVKNEYIGVIRGIRYLEGRDSLQSVLINQFESQIQNYVSLHAQDTLQLHFATERLDEAVTDRNRLKLELDDALNPPFYKSKTTFFILGALSVILLHIVI